MSGKNYGFGGWKMPILNLNDPDYCESGCPVCTRARKGSKLAKAFQALELKLMPHGCPWGKAREKKYGVKPDQPAPPPHSSTMSEIPSDSKS